jgi:lysozyme
MIRGIDVSHYQGIIDWFEVKRGGFEFAFIKSTDGVDFKDPMSVPNVVEARSAGVDCGLYHFLRHGQIAEQFAAFKMWYSGRVTLPPVCDAETSDLTATEVLNFLQMFPVKVHNDIVIKDPILYTDLYTIARWNQAEPEVVQSLANYPLWIAAPDEGSALDPGASLADLIAPWKEYSFRQFAPDRIAGITTLVDIDRFEGTLTQLRTLA